MKIERHNRIECKLLDYEQFRYRDPYDETSLTLLVEQLTVKLGSTSVLVRGLVIGKDNHPTKRRSELYTELEDLPHKVCNDLLLCLVMGE